MNFSTQGYKNTSPDKSRDYNIIPGSKITMNGVDIPLILVPIIGGKPDYTKKRVAKPGDPDIDFGEGIEGVLELPYAQVGLNTFAKDLPSLNSYGITPLDLNMQPLEIKPTFQGLSANPLIPRVQFNADDYVPRSTSLGLGDSIINDFNTSTSNLIQGSNVDPNAIQKAKADAIKSRQTDSAYRGASNPYGGWDMNSSLQALGAFIEMDPSDTNKTSRALGIAGSAGKFLFEGARNLFSGMAGMNRFQESQREQQEDLINAKRKDWLNYFKDGGKIMTGHFLKGNPNNPNVSAEVERGEYVQFPDGETQEVLGKRHSDGGELVDLPEGTRVISDYLTIGSKLARYFKSNHNLNVSASTKFATVMDRYKKKIGLTQLLEEEEKIMDQIQKQESIKSESTRELNMELLTGKLKELAPKKAEMEQSFKIFTNIVFDKQEETKAPGGFNFKKQQGGEVENVDNMETQQQGSEIEQIILMFCEITGQDPADVVAQLEQLDDAQIEQAIQQMVQVIQEAQQQQQQQPSQPEQPPVSDANPTNMQVQQPQMRSGGYKRGSGRLSSLRHFQYGGISPFTESDTVPTQSAPKIIDYRGEKWQVFEHPTDPSQNRMVPVRALNAQPPQSDYPAMQGYVSPYSTGTQFNTEYTSQHQQALEQERRNRAASAPGSLSGLSLQEKRRIQTVLRDSGYNIGATGVDGKIGPKTQAAMLQMMKEQPDVYAQYINIDVPKAQTSPAKIIRPVKTSANSGKVTQVVTAGPTTTGKLGSNSHLDLFNNIQNGAGNLRTQNTFNSNVAPYGPPPYNGRNVGPEMADLLNHTKQLETSRGLRNASLGVKRSFQEGGQITSQDIQELIQNFAIATNQDPEVIMAEFSKLTQSEMQQAMQQMVAQLEQSSAPKMRTGGQFLGKSEGIQYAQKGGMIDTEKDLYNLFQTYGIPVRTDAEVKFYRDTLKKVANKSLSPKGLFDLIKSKANGDAAAGIKDMTYDALDIQSNVGGGDNIFRNIFNPRTSEQTGSKNTFTPKPRTYRARTEWDEIVNKYKPDPTYTFDNRTGPESQERWSTLPAVFGVTPEGVDLSDPNALDEYAGKVQQTIRKVAPKLGDHFSTYTPSTQQGLQKALDRGLIKPEELKELGVKISGNKINMGAWGTVPPENVKKIQDIIRQSGAKNPDAMKEYTADNFYDNKGYYRIPQVEGVQFDTQEELDEFIENNKYELVEDINGNKVYYSGKPGLYMTPTLKGQKNELNLLSSPAAVAEEETSDLRDAPEHTQNAQNPFGILTPKYTRIKPSLFMPSLQQQGNSQATGISISPENTIRTLNQQYSGAMDTMTQSNPYTSGAFAANAFGQTANATNQAYMQAEALNAQDRRNVENINESRIQQRDALNSQRRDVYSQQSNQAMDNYIKSWRGYLDAQNTQNARDWNLTNEYNMIQAMNQDMSIGPFGNITQVGKPTFRVVLDGKSYEVDSKTGEVINKDKKPSSKKGGLLKGSIKKYLK